MAAVFAAPVPKLSEVPVTDALQPQVPPPTFMLVEEMIKPC